MNDLGTSPHRLSERTRFVQDHGWGGAQSHFLAGDASPRRYYRLRKDHETRVVMDAAPPQDVRPFIMVDELLRVHGFSAPVIDAADPDQGLLLLEDFGDDTFTRCLARGLDEAMLYERATDCLIALATQIPDKALAPLPVFDKARALREVTLLLEWYWPLMMDGPGPQDSFTAAWEPVLENLARAPRTIGLFDFHVDNLIWLPDRAGVAACGLLDFQDAVQGPIGFDLVSLLTDVRRDVPIDLRHVLSDRFYREAAAALMDRTQFDAVCAAIAAQRLTRILGTFIRLWRRDGKPAYLQFMLRVWRLLDDAMTHPSLVSLRQWFDHHWPPPLRQVPQHDDR